MKSFIGWVGGKSQLARHIISQIPAHTCYVEVFGGAGWVLFAKDKSSSAVEVYNDVNGELVNLFRVVKHRSAALAEALNLMLYSHEIYRKFQRELGGEG